MAFEIADQHPHQRSAVPHRGKFKDRSTLVARRTAVLRTTLYSEDAH
jgi:hypothetical protein